MKYVGTHSGAFHCDEVMACAILRCSFPDIKIIRTRDASVLKTCDICVDVGGGNFDHHYKGFDQRRENGVLYASAGLVWRIFGTPAVLNTLGMPLGDPSEVTQESLERDHDFAERVAQLVDQLLIEPIDLHDNGEKPVVDKYSAFGLSGIISSFNSRGDDEKGINFELVVGMCHAILIERIGSVATTLRGQAAVLKAAAAAVDGIMILDKHTPWQNALPEDNTVIYTVFPDMERGWRIVAANHNTEEGFVMKKPLPEAWRGLKDAELAAVCGVESAIFCHPAGFIAGADTKEDILVMAYNALEA